MPDADPRWHEIEVAFHEARGLPRNERAKWLSGHVDEDVRREVERLLSTDHHDDGFLDAPDPAVLATSPALATGTRVGSYEVIGLIAAGGMGEVYRARRADDAFERDVAIKVLRHHVLAPETRARFDLERRTLARLEHPHISRLLDGGTVRTAECGADLPYLVMELIDGNPIDAHCDQRGLDLTARLELFEQVCAAVQFAHRNLVVHRDLKPGNILVDRDGHATLLDFGVAALLEPSPTTGHVTTVRRITRRYASPEQVLGDPVTTATDVYALGVVLHELAYGESPYGSIDGPDYALERAICESEPCPPSVRGRRRDARITDLDCIVRRALRKRPEDRYPSVEQLADDVRRLIEHRPIRARPDSPVYRLRRFLQRHRRRAAIVAVAAVVTSSGVAYGVVSELRAVAATERERAAAEEARLETQEVVAFLHEMMTRANPYLRGRDATVREVLDEADAMIAGRLGSRPGAEAAVRLAIASTQVRLERLVDATPHLERAIEILRSLDDLEDDRRQRMLADALSLLGFCRTERSWTEPMAPAGVEALQREALAIARLQYGDVHPMVARTHNYLALAIWATHRSAPPWEEIEAECAAALAMFEQLDDGVTAAHAHAHLDMGFISSSRGDSARAARHFGRAADDYAALPAGDTGIRLTALREHARALVTLGRRDEALQRLREYQAVAPDGLDPDADAAVARVLEALEAG